MRYSVVFLLQDLALFYQMNSDTLSLQHMPHEAHVDPLGHRDSTLAKVRELLQSNRSGLMNGLLHSADVPWQAPVPAAQQQCISHPRGEQSS